MATIKAIAFDKTGTITTGRPTVTDVVAYSTTTREDLLTLTAVLESRSEHPIARAIVKKAQSEALTVIEPDHFEAVPGFGVSGMVNNQLALVGTEKLMTSHSLVVPTDLASERSRLEAEGKTVLQTYNGKGLGAIAVANEVRPEAAANIHS